MTLFASNSNNSEENKLRHKWRDMCRKQTNKKMPPINFSIKGNCRYHMYNWISDVDSWNDDVISFVSPVGFGLSVRAANGRKLDRTSCNIPRIELLWHNLSFGSRAFHIYAPKICNSLPPHILQSQTLSSFRRHLKTHYFLSVHSDP